MYYYLFYYLNLHKVLNKIKTLFIHNELILIIYNTFFKVQNLLP
jgi:hypothetical protein